MMPAVDSERRITEMSDEEFDAVIEAYIERESQDTGEIDAALFYEALEEIFVAEPTMETIELEGRIVGSQLYLQPATRDVPGVTVHDNEIVVHDIRAVSRPVAAPRPEEGPGNTWLEQPVVKCP